VFVGFILALQKFKKFGAHPIHFSTLTCATCLLILLLHSLIEQKILSICSYFRQTMHHNISTCDATQDKHALVYLLHFHSTGLLFKSTVMIFKCVSE